MKDSNLTTDTDWTTRLVEDHAGIKRVVRAAKRVAVIGIKPETVGGAAYYVPRAMQSAGYDVVPVPVYYPEVTEILNTPVHRSLATIDPPVDTVVVFRRPNDVPKHLEEILAAKPRAVWLQQGIRNAEVAEECARAGIEVVQDACFMVEMRG